MKPPALTEEQKAVILGDKPSPKIDWKACYSEALLLRANVERLIKLLESHGPAMAIESALSKAQAIRDYVAIFYDVSPRAMSSRLRTEHVAWARHVAMYLIRELTGLPILRIAELFKRDHGSVLHALSHVQDRRETDRAVHQILTELRAELERKLS
ncbi:MAG TPA: helix-turn-helix domain-containing protein [Verrucomicrobiota bacterium]|nr:helix-turn-helix domain-containing protein [Bryobacteraceae bacterium]HPU56785.1 helix-turn-helix domain-containing protein [Verrucomicrobiota bacterium]